MNKKAREYMGKIEAYMDDHGLKDRGAVHAIALGKISYWVLESWGTAEERLEEIKAIITAEAEVINRLKG
jgi:hypothetical protein